MAVPNAKAFRSHTPKSINWRMRRIIKFAMRLVTREELQHTFVCEPIICKYEDIIVMVIGIVLIHIHHVKGASAYIDTRGREGDARNVIQTRWPADRMYTAHAQTSEIKGKTRADAGSTRFIYRKTIRGSEKLKPMPLDDRGPERLDT
ncbi:hypothetical protein EVAR_15973_1 [Eumeta japonica]|uniref:Uncharacterized protein n=1 Tax=Eumeta variegata TaxID=151549 RepID=A0A4C1UM00_EUMVA|nr:hypothetical protein EVAR_15973_1 [Eumeta japonica]